MSLQAVLGSWCRPCVNEAKLEARRADRRRARAIQRCWYQRHQQRERAKSKERTRQLRQACAEQLRARDRASYARNAADRRAVAAAWRTNHREQHKATQRGACTRRRARKAAVEIGAVDFERIKQRDRMRCHLCRKVVKPADLHFDHVIPIAAGGAHIESNIAVSHAKCNQKKSTRITTLF